jgi:prepilin-type N-terminal cleavage/methylation domain-containing protein
MGIMRNRNTYKKHGFTIVELLIVVVVIAVLAAITIIGYNGIQTRANNSAADSAANTMSKKIHNYYSLKGNYPATTTTFFADLASYNESSLTGSNLAINSTLSASTGRSTLRVELCGTGAGVKIFEWNYSTNAISTNPILLGNTGGTCTPATA